MSRPSKFPAEFRARGGCSYRDSEGRTTAEVARESGVGTETFREWVRQDEADRGEAPLPNIGGSNPGADRCARSSPRTRPDHHRVAHAHQRRGLPRTGSRLLHPTNAGESQSTGRPPAPSTRLHRHPHTTGRHPITSRHDTQPARGLADGHVVTSFASPPITGNQVVP